MTSLFFLMMQLVISTKAGLVNNVQGPTNLAQVKSVAVGMPVKTGPDGYVELLLTPGSFLRLDENSEAMLDSVQLSNVEVRIVKGTAIIEVIDIDKGYPVKVTTGNLTTWVFEDGLYKFSDGVATVLQGKLKTGDASFTYDKGWQIFYNEAYRARKTADLKPTGLDVFSQKRSELIARANASVAPSVVSSRTFMGYNYWLFVPGFGAYTFLPQSNYRSPYGYRYYGVSGPFYGGGYARNNSGNSGGFGGAGGGGGGNNSSSGSTPSSDTGGGGGGGGGVSAPVTVATPSGAAQTPATYIESKSAPAPATQR
jgi:hypothetical protein